MLKNTSSPVSWRESESRARHFLEEQNYIFLAANHKICGVEIDLIMRSEAGEICLIEVKSLISREYLERRVTPKQIQRIRFALRSRLERGQQARAHLILVFEDRIEIEKDFFVRDL